ncbi:hypothetical protein AWB76_07611 [Caballeronia temeraria]|uniref:Uncharacterized protein n=1 Tax=Caballeronia temeraria TaxID=1777137 RepID=A0A158DWD6_9BURK|nr:hypothetical protein [Caballeronia temeraria]SAK98915.1 hypothetical protein AWB76_07611 [Caballeronia temeraria]
MGDLQEREQAVMEVLRLRVERYEHQNDGRPNGSTGNAFIESTVEMTKARL